MAQSQPMQQVNTLFNYQMRFVARKQQRVNKKLRQYRQEKIQKESSFNKNEGKCFLNGIYSVCIDHSPLLTNNKVTFNSD